ncbi:MAG: ribulokinase [Maritimibacter sp.]|nr:ribulokinase [Maritimibacter sp.]
MARNFCAVDVGTRSVRAGVFAEDGRQLSRDVVAITVHSARASHGEYSSEQIWQAVCTAVRRALDASGLAPSDISGIAFDATCSLVLTGGVPLGPDGRDTIAWFDHRALAEARDCTATGHPLIDRHGGSMSPEMQTPKLLWLKRNRRDLWDALTRAEDLTDHLTTRAKGAPVRSACTLTAKWAFAPDLGGWQQDFLAAVGLSDLSDRAGLTDPIVPPGSRAGGLSETSATELGLAAGTPVAAGMVDAFAGTLGGLASAQDPAATLALITGTSNCVMSMTPDPCAAPGLWGPLQNAILPGHFVTEGGQSAAGAVLDHVLASWPWPDDAAPPDHAQVLARLEQLVARDGAAFGRGIDVLPDFNGNRSPLADPLALGVISGLSLDRSLVGLCALYWRTAVALACGVRQIVDQFEAAGHPVNALTIAGGLTRSDLLTQLFADCCDLPALRPDAPDTVMLGTAMAAAAGSGLYPDLPSAAQAMRRGVTRFEPEAAGRYDRDHAAFRLMQRHRADLRDLATG